MIFPITKRSTFSSLSHFFRAIQTRMLSRSSRAIQPFCCFSSVPSSSPVVIIGGGIIGTSTLYHLSTLGIDAILLERDKLTSGTTWHAAGLMITFGSLNGTSTECKYINRVLDDEEKGFHCNDHRGEQEMCQRTIFIIEDECLYPRMSLPSS